MKVADGHCAARARVGSLLWLARVTRPDLTHAVAACARVAANPSKSAWDASTHLLQYLRATCDLGLVFRRDPAVTRDSYGPVGYVDADYAPNYGGWADNYRSTTGWLFKLTGAAVSHCSRRQTRLAMSSAESEYYAAADAAKEAVHLRRILRDLGFPVRAPTILKEDNQSCIKQSTAKHDLEASRAVDVRAHFLREHVRLGNLRLDWIPTQQQVADQLTKLVPQPLLERLRPRMGLSTDLAADFSLEGPEP